MFKIQRAHFQVSSTPFKVHWIVINLVHPPQSALKNQHFILYSGCCALSNFKIIHYASGEKPFLFCRRLQLWHICDKCISQEKIWLAQRPSIWGPNIFINITSFRLISKLLNAKSVLLSNRQADFQLFLPFGPCQHIIFSSPAALYDRRSIIKTIQFTFERNFPQYLTLPALVLKSTDRLFTCLLWQDDGLNFIFLSCYLYNPF